MIEEIERQGVMATEYKNLIIIIKMLVIVKTIFFNLFTTLQFNILKLRFRLLPVSAIPLSVRIAYAFSF